jgi:pyridoxine/pyridoxamine 5'-phosphate oxidase
VSLDGLQGALDESISRASRLTRELFGQRGWDAARVSAFVNDVRSATVATVTGEGKPHAVLVICGCADGVLYVTVSQGSRLRRNLLGNPAVAITISSGDAGVLLTGTASRAGRVEDLPGLLASWAARPQHQKCRNESEHSHPNQAGEVQRLDEPLHMRSVGRLDAWRRERRSWQLPTDYP